MTHIDASQMDYRQLNAAIRGCTGDITVTGCLGQRFIGAGLGQERLTITGTPGNALGAYLDGACIEVRGDAQDAVGDTMNAGRIVVHGSIGDAAGYAMRGGELYVAGNAGYRAGIHMKAYGIIIVLGLTESSRPIVSNFPCTGMHGGKLFLRSDCRDILFPSQVVVRPADEADLREIEGYLHTFCRLFGGRCRELLHHPFTVVTPNSSDPYRQLYVTN